MGAGHLVQSDQEQFIVLTKKLLSEASLSQKEPVGQSIDAKGSEVRSSKSEPPEAQPQLSEDDTMKVALSELQDDELCSQSETSSLEVAEPPKQALPRELPPQPSEDVSSTLLLLQAEHRAQDGTTSVVAGSELLVTRPVLPVTVEQSGSIQVESIDVAKSVELCSREPTPLPAASALVTCDVPTSVDSLTTFPVSIQPLDYAPLTSASATPMPVLFPFDSRLLIQQSCPVATPMTYPSCPATLSSPALTPFVDTTHLPSTSMPSYPPDFNVMDTHPALTSVEPQITPSTSNRKFMVEDVADTDSPSDHSTTSTEALDKEELAALSRDVSEATGSAITANLESASTSSMSGYDPSKQLPPLRTQSVGSWTHDAMFPSSHNIPWELVRQRSASMQYATIAGLYPSANMPALPQLGFFSQGAVGMSLLPSISDSVAASGVPSVVRVPSVVQQPPPCEDKAQSAEHRDHSHAEFSHKFASLPVAHVTMLTEAFGKFIYAMNTVLRDPTMAPLLDILDQQYGTSKDQPCPASPQSTASTVTAPSHEGPKVTSRHFLSSVSLFLLLQFI